LTNFGLIKCSFFMRCILNTARTNFGFRAAALGGAKENQSARRLRRIL